MSVSRNGNIRGVLFTRSPGWMAGLAPILIAAVFVGAASLFSGSPALATPDYAGETGQACAVCHLSASGGGGLTTAGESYSEDPGRWTPPAAGERKGMPLPLRLIHAAILYAHVFFGVIWIGTILYVHLVLKPKYALGGLPRSELRLAWVSMPLVAVTGTLLTVWRARLVPGLFSTSFGKLLLLKIGVFGLMLLSATFVTLYVGPRLKTLASGGQGDGDVEDGGVFTASALKNHDGTGGHRALIAAHGRVYDVTSSPLWREGSHARRHRAGQDLTGYLDDAPHGPEVLERYERVGDLVEGAAPVPSVVRIFTVNAYFNLVGCFVILLVLVLWRW